MKELMKDGRILRRVQFYKGCVAQEMQAISAEPLYSWERLAQLVDDGTTGFELFNSTMTAGSTCSGYIDRETFSRLDEHPLVFGQGDLAAKVHNAPDCFDMLAAYPF